MSVLVNKDSKIIVQVRDEEKLKKTVEVQPISGRIVVKDE